MIHRNMNEKLHRNQSGYPGKVIYEFPYETCPVVMDDSVNE